MPRDWTRSTIAQRIAYLCDITGKSQNALGLEAGIKSGPMSRFAAKKDRQTRSTYAARLADAHGVSFAWLARGEGQPHATEERFVETDDPVPERPDVIAAARKLYADEDRHVLDAAIEAFGRRSFKLPIDRRDLERELDDEIAHQKARRKRKLARDAALSDEFDAKPDV